MPCNIQFIMLGISSWVEESDCSINSHYVFKIGVSLIFKHNVPYDQTKQLKNNKTNSHIFPTQFRN